MKTTSHCSAVMRCCTSAHAPSCVKLIVWFPGWRLAAAVQCDRSYVHWNLESAVLSEPFLELLAPPDGRCSSSSSLLTASSAVRELDDNRRDGDLLLLAPDSLDASRCDLAVTSRPSALWRTYISSSSFGAWGPLLTRAKQSLSFLVTSSARHASQGMQHESSTRRAQFPPFCVQAWR